MKPRRFFGKLPRPIKLPAETGDERHVDGELSTNPVEGELSTDPACGEISTNLEENLKAISSLLGNPPDLMIRKVSLQGESPQTVAVVYFEGIVNKKMIGQAVIQPLLSFSDLAHKTAVKASDPLEALKLTLPTVHAASSTRSVNELISLLLEGKVAVLIDGGSGALYFDALSPPTRTSGEPTSEVTILGPQVGFNECIENNLALVRARLKHPKLRVERFIIGRKSRTDVRMVYLEGIAPDEVVAELRRRLREIDTDMILDSGMIRDLISERPYSPFILERTTERPDTVVAEVNLGRIAILVNGSPFAMLQPSQFFTLIETAEDYYLNALSASLLKLLRATAYIISVLAVPVYVAVVCFHYELVPLPLLLNIAATQEGVPSPLPVATWIVEVVLDIVREAGVRLPRQFGPVVSIFGAIVLGQSAIQAGFVPPGLIIVALLGTIASFAVPRSEKALSYRLIRFPLLLLASTLGFPGLTIGSVALVYHIASLKSFGIPYFVLYTPGHTARLARKLVRISAQHQPGTRPLAQTDKVRRGRVPEPRDPKNSD